MSRTRSQDGHAYYMLSFSSLTFKHSRATEDGLSEAAIYHLTLRSFFITSQLSCNTPSFRPSAKCKGSDYGKVMMDA
jgi:hypothetical protein